MIEWVLENRYNRSNPSAKRFLKAKSKKKIENAWVIRVHEFSTQLNVSCSTKKLGGTYETFI